MSESGFSLILAILAVIGLIVYFAFFQAGPVDRYHEVPLDYDTTFDILVGLAIHSGFVIEKNDKEQGIILTQWDRYSDILSPLGGNQNRIQFYLQSINPDFTRINMLVSREDCYLFLCGSGMIGPSKSEYEKWFSEIDKAILDYLDKKR